MGSSPTYVKAKYTEVHGKATPIGIVSNKEYTGLNKPGLFTIAVFTEELGEPDHFVIRALTLNQDFADCSSSVYEYSTYSNICMYYDPCDCDAW